MTTTAEGVETEQQREMLLSFGCTEMQGDLFSRALPVSEIRMLLSQANSIVARLSVDDND
jgi:EAL domain-containing protein (putative c-di-GMP-specific phosphodiesterase class I)